MKFNLVEVVKPVVHGSDEIIVFVNAEGAIFDRHARLNYISFNIQLFYRMIKELPYQK